MLALTYPTANCHLLLSRGIRKAPPLGEHVRAGLGERHIGAGRMQGEISAINRGGQCRRIFGNAGASVEKHLVD
jgi:hypothetical protein